LSDFALMVDIPTVPVSADTEEDSFETLRLSALAKHHKLMCDKLQALAEGQIPNLMLLFPPGSAKSTYADVVFVPWFMGLRPRHHVILASYASEIAKKQGRRARQLIKSASYRNLIGATLRSDQNAADEWALDNGSEFMAGGLLSGLTGNRAWLGICDDPIRGRDAAESQTIRDKTWEAWRDDFCSRLVPGAPQLMILTRWHEDDPAGRILPEGWAGESGVFEGRDGRTWHVLCCPAICESLDDPLGREIGETLWPEWFSDAHWKPFRSDVRSWTSLYQQRPAPDEGTFFQRGWFKEWEAKPALRYYGSSDYAVTDGGGDYTVHRVWGIDASGAVYRVDGWRGQATSDVWIEEKLNLIAKHKPLAWFGEGGVIQKAIEPMLRRRMLERKVFCRLEWLPSVADKPTRARSFQAMAASGRVYFERGADLSEFLSFPAGKHDDEVDVASLIGRAIDQAHPAVVSAASVPPKRRDYGMRDIDASDDWKVV
jgi:predicted phage terminase large subunit-like protein